MFRHVLLPVDLSPRNLPAIDCAARICDADGRVTLVHVIEPILDMSFDEGRSFYDEIEQAAAEKLASFALRLAGSRLEVRRQILYGNRVAQILQFAEEQAADLVVLSSHPLDPQQPAAGWGTLSYRIGILTRCPVLLVKAPLR